MNNDRFKVRVAVKQANGSFKVFDVVDSTFRKDAILVRCRDETHPQCDLACVINGTDTILLQCTGLKDCKRRLIYEGDILAKNGNTKEVVWHNGGFGVLNYPLTHSRKIEIELGITHFASHNMDVFARFEVVGSIHENKELLG